ncbi:MAG: fliR [Capsulimonas sp.]|jgi:flagellar biosynthetic protein FliR|nr:fliR [Capsulimonas sp.]
MFDNLTTVSAGAFWQFLQVFARVTSLFVSAPIFGNREVPSQVKVGLSAVISIAVLPVVQSTVDKQVPVDLYSTVSILLVQIAIGLLIGLVVSFLFVAVRVAGSIIDYQMGFTQASTFNPQFNETVSPISNFQYQYSLVLYLLGNGHWLMLGALVQSFTRLPAGQMIFNEHSRIVMTDLMFQFLVAGVQIAAPSAAVLLITDISFALLNRAMPQMQVFYVGAPVKILVGLTVVIAVLPLFTFVVGGLIMHSQTDIFSALRAFHR